jgi:hypothetical protein
MTAPSRIALCCRSFRAGIRHLLIVCSADASYPGVIACGTAHRYVELPSRKVKAFKMAGVRNLLSTLKSVKSDTIVLTPPAHPRTPGTGQQDAHVTELNDGFAVESG